MSEDKPMSIRDAAKKGGQVTKERHGPDFYKRIGKMGGDKVKAKGADYSQLGKLGGKARVAQERQREAEKNE